MSDLRIDLVELEDQYIDYINDESGYQDTAYPDLWKFSTNGEEWLTDRYWVLPAAVCFLGEDEFKPVALPESAIEKASSWVAHMKSDLLLPATCLFAANFGGVFTKHGLTAYAMESEHQLHVLADDDDNRVGLLMPHIKPTEKSVTIPVPPEVADMYKRIRAADVGELARWQSWELAAALAVSL